MEDAMERETNSHTVLIVEDNADLLSLMQRHLEREGYATAGAGTGREALIWVGEQSADLLLVDYELPDMNGKELVEALQEQGTPIPFVLVTGHGDERLAVDMMKRGARDYIMKEGEFLELLTTVVNQVVGQLVREQRLREAEQALQENEAQYRGIFNAARDAVFVVDFAGKIVDANPEANRMFGFHREEFHGMPVRQLIHSDHQHIYDLFILDIQKQGKFQSEAVGEQKDGTMIDIDMRGSVFIFKGRNHFVFVFRDISERKYAEEELKLTNQQLRNSEQALREREKRLGAIFQGAAIGIALVDLGGHAIESNQALQTMLGYSRIELRRKTFADITYMEDRQAGVQIFEDIAQGKCDHYQVEVRYVRKDSSLMWVRLTASLVRGEEGKPNYIIHMIEDITDWKQAENSLQESESKYRSLFENMTSGFAYHKVVLDANSEPVDYVFLEVNDAFERLTGLERDDILGKRVTEILPRIRNSEFDWIETYGEVALTGQEIKFDQHSEALGRWFCVSAYSPRKGYFATVFEDITERRLIEEELRMFTVDVEKTNRELEQYVRVVSQDLQAPLDHLSRECGKLEVACETKGTTQEKETLHGIRRDVEQIQNVVEGLLEYSRIQTQGKAFEPMDLGESARGALEKLAKKLRQNEGQVEITELPKLSGDPGQWGQLFVYLIGHAIEYRSEQPPIVKISSCREEQEWHITVEYNGVGIDASDHERVFEMFERRQGAEGKLGTGVGLAICKKVVERHGGRIWIETPAEGGNLFHITIPCKQKEPCVQ
jgi:PAS domain S-box-containing protein